MSKEKIYKGNKKSKVLTGVGIGLVVLVIAGVFGLIVNVNTNKTGYTQTQYEQSYINGYNDGYEHSFKDKESLQQKLSVLQTNYTNVLNEYNSTLDLYNELTQSSLVDKETIINLEQQISLQKENLLKLQAELKYYEDLNFSLENTYSISFYNGEELIDCVYITKGGALSYDKIPIKKNYSFVGWSLDNENVVDINSLEINEDLNIYAIFEFNINGNYTFDINYNSIIGGDFITKYNIVSHVVIENNDIARCVDKDSKTTCSYYPNKDFFAFNGVSLVLNMKVDNSGVGYTLLLGFNFNIDTNSWEYVGCETLGSSSVAYEVTSAVLTLD